MSDNKRPYPGFYELYQVAMSIYPHYHYRDDTNPPIDIWLYAKCLQYAEGWADSNSEANPWRGLQRQGKL